jgi:hypothetical protein
LVFTPGLSYNLKVFIRDLSEAGQELFKGLAWVQIGDIRAIAHHESMHGFPAIDPTLVVLELVEKGFLVVVGGWQTRDTIAGEQPPPTLADGLNDVVRVSLLVRVVRRFLFQVFQDRLDFLLHLAGLAPLPGLVFQPQAVREFD